MTSPEREADNVYGGKKEPQDGILTYTWGRFQTKHGIAIDIKGTSWKIPAVREDHFSVEDFCRVVQQMNQDVDYAWIDIACIDQENDAVKMEEIGRQAAIFNKAHTVYVWLSHLQTTDLQTHLDDIFRAGSELEVQINDSVWNMSLSHSSDQGLQTRDRKETKACGSDRSYMRSSRASPLVDTVTSSTIFPRETR